MKYYKIIITSGDPLIVTEDKIQDILDSTTQLVRIRLEGDDFRLLNKAHIVQAYIDKETTEKNNRPITKNPDNYELVDGVFKLKDGIIKNEK